MTVHSFGRKDFFIVKKNSTRLGASLIRFEIGNSSYPDARLGITVSKKYGNAVSRNRFKRMVREAFSLRYPHLPPGMLVHVYAKSPKPLDFALISDDFDQLISAISPHVLQPST